MLYFLDQEGRPAPFAASYMVCREDKRTNNTTMPPTLKNNAAASYQGAVKIELLKGTGLLDQAPRALFSKSDFCFFQNKLSLAVKVK